MLKRLFNCFLLTFLVVSFNLAAFENGYVSGKNVNLRSKPANYSERLAVLDNLTKLQIISEQGGWMEVYLPVTVYGWVNQDNMDAENVVKKVPCPIYTGPGVQFTAFYMASQGTRLEGANRVDGAWIRVAAPGDATAWIHRDYVAKGNPPDAESIAASASREKDEKLRKLENEANQQAALRDAAKAKARLASLEKEKAELEAKQLQSEMEESRRQNAKKAKQAQEEMARMESEWKRLEDKLAEDKDAAKRKADMARAEVESLSQEHLATEQKAREVMAKVQAARTSLNASEQEYMELQKRLAEAREQSKNAAAQIEQLQAEHKQKSEEIKLTETSITAINAKIKLLSMENRRVSEEMARMETDSMNTSKQLEVLKQDSQKRAAVQAELKKLQAELAQMEQESELTAKIEETRKSLEEHRRKRQEAQTALDELKKNEGIAAQEALSAQEALRREKEIESERLKEKGLTRCVGLLLPLSNRKEGGIVSHALCEIVNGKYKPIYYLNGNGLDLDKWNRFRVEITGKPKQVKGWDCPLLTVTGISKK